MQTERRLTVELNCRRPGELLGLRRRGLRKRRFIEAGTRIVPRSVSVYGAIFDVQLTDDMADAACSAGLVF